MTATVSHRGYRRGLAVARAGYGAALLLARRPLLRSLGTRPDRSATLTVGALGARHVVQAVVTWLCPDRRVVLSGTVVDGLHATSMLALAAADARRRRAALVDAADAAVWAAFGIADLARSLRRPAQPAGVDDRPSGRPQP